MSTMNATLLELPESGERKFRCPESGCGRRFNRKYTLTEHLKTHTGEKPFVCRFRACGKRFSTSGNLSRHRRLHGPLEPLACPEPGCDAVFMSDIKRERHIKYHHRDHTRVCEVPGCGKTFSTTGNLNRHLKNHHSEAERDLVGCSPHRSDSFDGSCSDYSESSSGTSSPTSVDDEDWADSDCSWLGADLEVGVSATTEPWTPEMLDILAQMLLD